MKLLGRKFIPTLAVLTALAVLAIAATGCGFVKPKSLALSQPQGIGPVRVHFVICTVGGKESICGPNEEEGEIQYLIGIAVPPGSTPPASFAATPVGGGAPIVFNRSEEVTSELTASSVAIQKLLGEIKSQEEKEEAEKFKELLGGSWPPTGLQGVGYLSEPVKEVKTQSREWSVDADFGLPAATAGNPFTGPFATGIAFGLRVVEPGKFPANRAVHCIRLEEGTKAQESDAFCSGSIQESQLGISNLLIAAPTKAATAFVGGKGKVSFPLKYGGGAATLPSFALSATTTAKGGKAKLGSASFTPKAPNPQTHLSPAGTGSVTVTLPPKVKPGTYTVTLTAKTAQGGTASGVAKLKVSKPKIKFGAVKLDTGKGTATLPVKVPGAGKLTISGKGLATVKKKAKKAKTLKLTVSPTGSAAAQLARAGSVKLKVKATFKPTSGISVSKTKTIVLQQH